MDSLRAKKIVLNVHTLLGTLFTYSLHDLGFPRWRTNAKRAVVNDFFETSRDGSDWCYVAVSNTKRTEWPFLTITQRFWPSAGGFDPGVILIPETKRLFIGAGERLLAYDLEAPQRLWEDSADTGFWCWARHGDTILCPPNWNSPLGICSAESCGQLMSSHLGNTMSLVTF